MLEPLFDLSAEYDAMLNRGIRLSGENREFFMRGRIASLLARLPLGFKPARILDFGCGLGTTAAYLAEKFPEAEVLGVDTSANAIAHALETYGSKRVGFRLVDTLGVERSGFDLCHASGVFHHIAPEHRAEALSGIHGALRRGGRFALFENNPWNPGTRLVMARIPFDRDAQTLSVPAAKKMLGEAQFAAPLEWWSLFYFPRMLASLRFLEGPLAGVPFGAQYCVLGTKSNT